jgi:glycosyltransferase involved in cell wall biosynthesis
MELSVVATIYNDENIVPILAKEITGAIKELGISYEIIFVNDNSSDRSEKAIELESANDPCVKGLSLSRNYGQQIAMSAGIRAAKGKYVLIMDGDMQNPPAEIPRLYKKICEGFDIIYCISKTRNSFWDELTSSLFWFTLVKIFKVKIIKDQLMMKIMTNEFVSHYNLYNEVNRTVTGITSDIGLNYGVIEITNAKRHSGKSNYNFFKRFNLMVDIIISLSTAPLNFMIYLGFIIFFFTCIACVYYLYQYLFFDILPGFTTLLLTRLFFGGITILMLGFIGRYLSNIYTEVRQRPLYFVRKKHNFND